VTEYVKVLHKDNYQIHLCEATFSLTSYKLLYLLVTLSLLLFILNDVGQRPEVFSSWLASAGRYGLSSGGQSLLTGTSVTWYSYVVS